MMNEIFTAISDLGITAFAATFLWIIVTAAPRIGKLLDKQFSVLEKIEAVADKINLLSTLDDKTDRVLFQLEELRKEFREARCSH